MSTDNLFFFLDMVRAEMPEVPDEAWARIKRALSDKTGGDRVYVPTISKKRSHLEALAELNEATTTQQISKMLGVSVRHARRLKRLRG